MVECVAVKVTVQFETHEGNGQNEIVSHMNRSGGKALNQRKKYCNISYTERDFETEKFDREVGSRGRQTFKSFFSRDNFFYVKMVRHSRFQLKQFFVHWFEIWQF